MRGVAAEAVSSLTAAEHIVAIVAVANSVIAILIGIITEFLSRGFR